MGIRPILKRDFLPLSQFSPYLVESAQVHSYPPNASVHFFPEPQFTPICEHSFTSKINSNATKLSLSRVIDFFVEIVETSPNNGGRRVAPS